MEEKTIDILEKILDRLDSLDNDINDLKQGQAKAEERLTSIESKIDAIQKHLIEMDAKNADRHVVIVGEIKDRKKDLTNVELITSSNWNDIAKLKAVK